MDELKKKLYENTVAKLKSRIQAGKNASSTGLLGKANKNSETIRPVLMNELVKPTVSRIYKGAQAGTRILNPSLGYLQNPQESVKERNISYLRDLRDAGAGAATAAGLTKLPAALSMGIFGAGMNSLSRKVQGQKTTGPQFITDTITSMNRTIPVAGTLRATQPIMGAAMQKLSPALSNILAERATRSALNVGEGLVIDQTTGMPTTPLSVGIDAAFGLVGKSGRVLPQALEGANVKGLKNSPLEIDDGMAIRDIYKRMTANWTTNGKPDLDQLAKDESLVDTILQSKYGATVEELRKPLAQKIEGLFKIAQEDTGVLRRGGIKLGVKGADDVADPLTQEARKYKSAEEFVESQPTLYRGEGGSNKFSGRESFIAGRNYTVDMERAKTFGEVGEYSLKPNSKVLKINTIGKDLGAVAKDLKVPESSILSPKRLREELSQKGYDAVQYTTQLGVNGKIDPNGKIVTDVIVLNDKAIASKSQLTDIWNKANQPATQAKGPMMGLVGTTVKPRGFEETVKKSNIATKQVKEGLESSYKTITNKETIEDAAFTLKTVGWDASKKQVFDGPFTPQSNALGQLLVKQAQKEKRYDDAIEIIENLAKKGTAAGQSIQAFSIWSKLTPEGMLKYAKNQIDTANQQMGFATKLARGVFGQQAPKMTPQDAEIITNLMKKSQKASSEAEQAEYARQALEHIGKKLPWGISDVIDEYRYNNMLSGPLTHLRNLYSNVLQSYLVRPATLAAEGKPMQALQYEAKALQAIPRAFGEAIDTFMSGKRLGRLDDVLGAGAAAYKPKRLGKLYNIPSSALEASDTFFTNVIKQGEMARGATEAEAQKAAQYWVFRQGLKPDQQGYLLNSIDNLTGAMFTLRKFGLGWTIPFLQTPMNIAKQSIEFSPAGLLTTVGAKNKREQIAKAGLGSIAMLAGANFAMQDRTTWDVPTDPKAKELFYATGRKPYSILIKDKWVPMQYLGPFAWAVGLPAAFKHYQEDSRTALSDSEIEKITQTMASGLKFWTQQTFVQGLGQFVKMAEGDYDYNLPRIISNFGTQLNPMSSLQRYVAQILDPVYRKARGTTFQDKIVQNIQAGIPGQTQKLEAYTNPLGEESKRNITALTMPWGLGIPDDRFELGLQKREEKLQNNAVKNKIKKEIEAGVRGESALLEDEGTFTFFNPDTGKEKNIDLAFLSKEPTTAVAKARYDSKRYEKAIDIYRDDEIPEETRTDLLNRIGISTDDLDYYDVASSENTIKSIHVKEAISSIPTNDRKQLLETLVSMKRPVNNKFILANGVVDDLVEDGVITKEEGKAIKDLEFDKDGKVKVKLSGRGGSAKLKNIKFVPLDISPIKNVLGASGGQIEGLQAPRGQFETPRLQVQNVTPIQQPKFQVRFNL